MRNHIYLFVVPIVVSSLVAGLGSVGRSQPSATPFPTEGSFDEILPDASNDQQPSPRTQIQEPTAPSNLEQPLICPPGQFPSAFVDVFPTHWAYEAVHQLTSRPLQCFALSENDAIR
ncbi:MAG: hypothetical protein AAGA75_26590 [Cyanobacteria bacterium P01_E01_bin.6]